jgi:hypothetical protein
MTHDPMVRPPPLPKYGALSSPTGRIGLIAHHPAPIQLDPYLVYRRKPRLHIL